MAYKFVDADQLDADLTTVAAAIRAKGETAEQLSFPSGMAAAIEAISTGVELNFEVVGAEQPSNPAENTIWINTEVEISTWIFSPVEPEAPVEGMAWILVKDSGDVAFNALKKNAIQVYPVSVKLYTGGAWEKAEAYIYQDDVWTELVGSLVLFDGDDGGDNTDVTGGWSTITQAGGETTVTSSSVAFCSTSASTVRRAGTVNAVDLSQYKTLYFDGVNNSIADSDNYSFMLLTERSNTAAAVATVRQPFNTRGVVSIDLTAITDRTAVYVAITNSSGSVYSELYRCWAE